MNEYLCMIHYLLIITKIKQKKTSLFKFNLLNLEFYITLLE